MYFSNMILKSPKQILNFLQFQVFTHISALSELLVAILISLTIFSPRVHSQLVYIMLNYMKILII